jgi:hypothetical protein
LAVVYAHVIAATAVAVALSAILTFTRQKGRSGAKVASDWSP